ncbi:MAG: hypothetical protein QG671_1765, partial [Actinomycetota bacterium]|nr:hypothetical protein [Actinomycetota bacterium]
KIFREVGESNQGSIFINAVEHGRTGDVLSIHENGVDALGALLGVHRETYRGAHAGVSHWIIR